MNTATILALIAVIAVFAVAIYGSYRGMRDECGGCSAENVTRHCDIRRTCPSVPDDPPAVRKEDAPGRAHRFSPPSSVPSIVISWEF